MSPHQGLLHDQYEVIRGWLRWRFSTAVITLGLQGGATSQSQAGPTHAMGEEGSLLLTFYSLSRACRVAGLPWLYPARREAQSSGVACKSHQANPETQVPSAPNLFPALSCPKTLIGEEKTKQQEKILLQLLPGDGPNKQFLCKRSQCRPRGVYSRSLPEILHLWRHEVSSPAEDVLLALSLSLALSLPVCFSLFQEGSPA